MSEERTAGDAMLRHPTLQPADLTVAEARAAFDRSEKTHLLLLTSAGLLVSTVARGEVEADVDSELPAATAGTLRGRTISPDAPLCRTRHDMVERSQRRLAVVDDSMHLLGLLCLKRSLTGFCTDEGVLAMRRARRATKERCSLSPP